jgi:hypothetical protein
MITARSLAIGSLGFVLSTQLLNGQSAPNYRGRDAPRRDIARLKKEADDARAAQEKAGLTKAALSSLTGQLFGGRRGGSHD